MYDCPYEDGCALRRRIQILREPRGALAQRKTKLVSIERMLTKLTLKPSLTVRTAWPFSWIALTGRKLPPGFTFKFPIPL
jgi:hypothetical protein